jgi:hypothetical protein
VAAWLDLEEFGPGQALAREGASGYAFFIRDEGSGRVQLEDGTLPDDGRPVDRLPATRVGQAFGGR